METNKTGSNKKVLDATHREVHSTSQELLQASPKESVEETICSTKSKDNADTVSLR